MTAISEAILIEMAQRFRKLEDACKYADLALASRQEFYERKLADAEARLCKPAAYEQACRDICANELDRDHIMGIRERIERCMNACFDDLVTMQEALRRMQQ